MNATVNKPNGLPRSIRLIKSAEFGAVLSANKTKLIRSYSDFFTISALKTDQIGLVRFGFTVGKQNAHLSVERALVKRLLREKARTSRQTLIQALSDRQYGLDINCRLKRKLPDCSQQDLSKKARKILIRNDIEKLFGYFYPKCLSHRGNQSECPKVRTDCMYSVLPTRAITLDRQGVSVSSDLFTVLNRGH